VYSCGRMAIPVPNRTLLLDSVFSPTFFLFFVFGLGGGGGLFFCFCERGGWCHVVSNFY